MSVKATDNLDLKNFLYSYINDYDNLSNDKRILLMEFFIKDKILNKSNFTNNNNVNKDDLMKYAFLGYWIYNQIEREKLL